ncbi:tRNA (adenine(37)-N6)-methyltransferase-like [Limulus polyphemus]|uniref:tRNA (Adenine(37)-N6)-methyltransferase-like n=1 Tax=Limulus polyphemus TaxID=6850 RepID=A0ABM1TLY0_LIMPO|nr:tRNA (adenine(37)-N6)-methyltransferase-like [Limulus polyphemus]XP_022256886.1 tRNA (adenine(37)-N6)-methyltransferase-like [Limulus polyphemus]
MEKLKKVQEKELFKIHHLLNNELGVLLDSHADCSTPRKELQGLKNERKSKEEKLFFENKNHIQNNSDNNAGKDVFTLRCIGKIHSWFKTKNGTPRQPSVCDSARAKLVIDKHVFSNPEHALQGIEDFSHIWILFMFHKNQYSKKNEMFMRAKVHPPRLNGKSMGTFATRSPHRINALGLTLAKLEKVEGEILHVTGVDILDETPVVDIKPYIPDYDTPFYQSMVKSSVILNSQHQSSETRSVSYGEKQEFDLTACHLPAYCLHKNDLNVNTNYPFNKHLEFPEKECKDKKSKFHKDNFPSKVDFSNSSEQDFEKKCNNVLDLDSKPTNEKLNCDNVHTLSINKTLGNKGIDYPENTGYFLTSDKHHEINSQEHCSLQYKVQDGTVADVVTTQGIPLQLTETSSQSQIPAWVCGDHVPELAVYFTQRTEKILDNFHTYSAHSSTCNYCLKFLSGAVELKKVITSILKADPRSVYRRMHCTDRLYFFTVDTAHLTCWFDDSDAFVEVVNIKPLACAPTQST